jgi:hypothetical protein
MEALTQARAAEATDPAAVAGPRAVVENLYDLFRESRLNVKYYGKELARYQWWNVRIEVAAAIASSTTLLSLPLFSGSVGGKILTGLLGVVAAVLGVLKPVLNFSKRIERLSKLWAGYLSVFVSAQSIVRRVQLTRSVDSIQQDEIRSIHDKMDALCVEDDPCPKPKDLDRLQEEVENQYPLEEFWWPPKTSVA